MKLKNIMIACNPSFFRVGNNFFFVKIKWQGECKVENPIIELPKLFGSFSNFDLAELAAEKIPGKEINHIVHG